MKATALRAPKKVKVANEILWNSKNHLTMARWGQNREVSWADNQWERAALDTLKGLKTGHGVSHGRD